jgi:hypothetical protein
VRCGPRWGLVDSHAGWTGAPWQLWRTGIQQVQPSDVELMFVCRRSATFMQQINQIVFPLALRKALSLSSGWVMRQRRYDGKIEGWPRDGHALCHRAIDGTLSPATDELTIEAGFCRLYNVTSARIDDIFTASDVTNPDDVIANNISVSALNPQLSVGSRCELTWWWGRLQMAAQHFMGIARCECLACAISRPYGATQAPDRCCNNLLWHLLFPSTESVHTGSPC